MDVEDIYNTDNETAEELSKNWTDGQITENIKDKVSNYVKFRIAKLRGGTNPLSGLNEVVNIDDIWSQLQNIHRHDVISDEESGVDDFIETLTALQNLNPVIKQLIKNLKADANFRNAYVSMMKTSISQVKAVTIEKIEDDYVVDYAIQNRDSFPGITLSNKYLSNILYKVKQKKLGDFQKKYTELKTKHKNITMEKIYVC